MDHSREQTHLVGPMGGSARRKIRLLVPAELTLNRAQQHGLPPRIEQFVVKRLRRSHPRPRSRSLARLKHNQSDCLMSRQAVASGANVGWAKAR